MLKEILLITNVGRFELAKPTQSAGLGHCTLIFGENGWGKSTFADILRSLTTNNPAILTGRKTLAADGPLKVVLRFSKQNSIFENGEWAGARPKIAVYDSAFINDNVFSGDIVSADHLKAQYGLVVGEEGVKRVRRIVELDEENRENNKAIKENESKLVTMLRSIGLPKMALKDFLNIGVREDIVAAIAVQETKVQQIQRAGELKAAGEPSFFPVPTETVKFRDLLSGSIDDVATDALVRVREHIAAHECSSIETESDVSHESWIEGGVRFVTDQNCPFCGQILTDRTLVDAYKNYFGAIYKEMALAVKKGRDILERYSSGDFKTALTTLAEQNSVHYRYWYEVGKLTPPESSNIEIVIDEMEQAAANVYVQFVRKQENLVEAVADAEATASLAAWDAGRMKVVELNEKIEEFLASVKALKVSIDPTLLPSLEHELTLLRATQRRFEPDILALVGSLEKCSTQKKIIAKELADERKALSEYGRSITNDLGREINSYLERLAANFRIDYREPNYQSKEPSASYSILIKEVPVSPRNAELDKPSFRNTLSAGDKSTLALALFLARTNADPNLADTIVVLDDPFTSLDTSRRQFTAIETRRICSRALQTIVLSHDKNFLRLLWHKIDRSKISSLAFQSGARGMSTIAPFDIEAATLPRHITERIEIEEFLQGEKHEPKYIRTRLRTVCEDFYRKGDPSMFSEAASFEEIIRRLQEAPADHPYKSALDDLRDINEYSRGENHAEDFCNPSEETSVEELREFCRRVIELTRGF